MEKKNFGHNLGWIGIENVSVLSILREEYEETLGRSSSKKGEGWGEAEECKERDIFAPHLGNSHRQCEGGQSRMKCREYINTVDLGTHVLGQKFQDIELLLFTRP